jgi:hypothetical protein
MLNRFFGDFFSFVVLFSQDLAMKSPFHFKRNVRKMCIASFGSKSLEGEACLWNLMGDFDGFGA